MAQMAQAGTERNTDILRSVGRAKSRNWAFTLNNYMEADIKNLCKDEYQYIFQEETGKEGTPHLQGTIMLKQPQALSYMKKINGRAHWEICRNKFASINYCQKGESRTGMMYTNMDVVDLFGTKEVAQEDPRKMKKEDFKNWINKKIDEDFEKYKEELMELNL